jgi:hypothetical protein
MLGGNTNGLDFGQMIRERYPFIQTIFVSADIDYSLDVFDLEAVYFLNKPVSSDRLGRAWDMALRRISSQKASFLRINSRGHHLNVPYKDIMYLESERRIIIVHRTANEHQFYAQLDEVEQLVPDSFIRIHQSYLVNMHYITSLAKGRCQMLDGMVIRSPRKGGPSPAAVTCSSLKNRPQPTWRVPPPDRETCRGSPLSRMSFQVCYLVTMAFDSWQTAA